MGWKGATGIGTPVGASCKSRARVCAACWTGGVLASSVRSSRGNLDREDVTEDVATRHGLRLCRRTYVALASSGLRTLSVALHDRTMLLPR